MSYLDGHLTLAEQKAYLDKVRAALAALAELDSQGWNVDWDAVDGHEIILLDDEEGREHYVCGYVANVDIADDKGGLLALSWEWDQDEWLYQPRGSDRYRPLNAHEPADVAAAAARLAREHSGREEEQP